MSGNAEKVGMVERVARAICRHYRECQPAYMALSEAEREYEIANAWDLWVGEAKVAIEAMRQQAATSEEFEKIEREASRRCQRARKRATQDIRIEDHVSYWVYVVTRERDQGIVSAALSEEG